MKLLDYSVVITVHSGSKLDEFQGAIKSIFQQTHRSNDIIIVCDGEISSDLDLELTKISKKSEIRIVRLKKNIGPGPARNEGIEIAKNDYVGIMDSDDKASKTRFELQVAAIQKNPSLVIVGGQIEEFDDRNRAAARRIHEAPTSHEEIVKFGRRRSPFSAGVMVLSRKTFKQVGGFKSLRCGEDYELAMRMLKKGQGMNLPETVLTVYVGEDAISRRKSLARTKDFIKCRYLVFKEGYSTFFDFIITASAQLLIFAIPCSLASNIYVRFLRK